MIRFKKKMKYIKGFILYALLCVFAFLPFMSFNVNAWSLDSNGNLQSDNILTFANASYNGLGVNYVCEDNQIILSGTASSTGPLWVSVNYESGTYTFQTFNDFTMSLAVSLRSGYDRTLARLDYDVLNNSITFTSTYDITILAVSVYSGVNYDGVVLTPTLTTGSIPLRNYEPYGDVYYSQENYNNVAQDLLGGLEGYDAIDLYYSDSITYVSTDNGQTFTNANNQDVSNNYVYGLFDRNNLIIDKDNPWNANAIYMVRVNFSQPLFLWRLQILNSAKPTTFLKVVCNDLTITNFNYFVDTEHGNTSYIISDNIFQTCDSVEFYFKINQYVSGTSTSWILDYKGYNVGIDSYNEGYRDGQDSMTAQIDDLKSNINVLKQQITSLNEQLSNNFGWQSLFFGMADTPLYTVSQMLGFEVLGVNLFNAFIGFITVLAILWVLKRLVK